MAAFSQTISIERLMRTTVPLAVLAFIPYPALACITCNKQVQEGIYNSTFFPNLLTMLSAFIVLAIVVAVLSAVSAKRHRSRIQINSGLLTPVPLTTAATVLHQILQWHEMLSFRIPTTDIVGKSVNMFWDGVFHAFCLVVVLIGVVLLWNLLGRKDIDRSGKLLAGGMLLGWGLFNIVEGIIDHHILKLHNVFELAVNHGPANYIFLGISVVMIIVGFALVNSNTKHVQTTSRW